MQPRRLRCRLAVLQESEIRQAHGGGYTSAGASVNKDTSGSASAHATSTSTSTTATLDTGASTRASASDGMNTTASARKHWWDDRNYNKILRARA